MKPHCSWFSCLLRVFSLTISDFPCSWWPWQIRGQLIRDFVACSPAEFAWCFFSWLHKSYRFWGGRLYKVKCRFHYIFSKAHTVHVTHWLSYRAEACLLHFYTTKSFCFSPPVSLPCTSEGSPSAQTMFNGWELCSIILLWG